MDTLAQDLQKAQLELDTPGILVGVRINEKEHYFSSGILRQEDIHQTFYIYSITKTFTAICLLKLIEEGLLSLETRLSDLLGEHSFLKETTIHHLLQHTSGLPEYSALEDYHTSVYKYPSQPWSRVQILQKLSHKERIFPPGQGWSYSNTGYMLLHQIIEHITGQTYAQVVKRKIIEPLGLFNTQVVIAPDREKKLLPGFDKQMASEDGDIRPLYHPDWVATGLLSSNIPDLLKFYSVLFRGTGLQPDSLKLMKRSVRVPGDFPPFVSPSYGLGVMHDPDFPLGENIGHGGHGPGYTILLNNTFTQGGQDIVICILCNSTVQQPLFSLWNSVLQHFCNGE